ncbi:MAG TPA: sulfur carrier protein ThiS [Burkholderiaceae bacterium]|nr:sulfur carrier protein ThiS [Burkholderiaceae bacterium]
MNTIVLNGAPHRIAPNTTLADFIAATGQPAEALATAVNGEFVARTARPQHVLHEGDAVFTFQPITGG